MICDQWSLCYHLIVLGWKKVYSSKMENLTNKCVSWWQMGGRELEWEVEPEDGTELLPSQHKTWMAELLLIDKHRKYLLRDSSYSWWSRTADYWNNQRLSCCSGSRSDPSVESSSTADNLRGSIYWCCQTAPHVWKSPVKAKSQTTQQTSLLSYRKKGPRPPQLLQPPPWPVNGHQHWG